MTKSELRVKIQSLAKTVYKERASIEQAAIEYDELTKFPELKDVIVSLLGPQFDLFVASIDWVAPTPTTFRINLKNNENFYLVHTSRTFIAEVEGKKYYLLNLNEQQNAQKAIARILRYGAPNIEGEVDASEFDTGSSGGGSDEESLTDISVDTETDVDA
jgi:hypothetical protein|tara:strand:+ start:132 stop:611 length:480 start_codon:yes stop_codon:yes gene_type:complete